MVSATSGTNGGTQPIILYTPYTEIFVPPGESVNYPLDVINKGNAESTADISVSGLPKGWTWELKSGNLDVGQVAVLPGERKNILLQVQVPLRVNKGRYHFRVLAGGLATLPLTVAVSEQGVYKTEFSTGQANMEGAANTTFTFSAKLKNSPFVIEAVVNTMQMDETESGNGIKSTIRLQEALERVAGVSSVQFTNNIFRLGSSVDATAAIARAVVESGFDLTYLQKKEYGLDDIYNRYFERSEEHEQIAQ
jgi:hypothetical protein